MLTQKFHFLEVVANTSMTWWVSSVVFCSTVIGIIWLYKSDVFKLPSRLFSFLGITLHLFFLSVVIYGLLVIYRVIKIEEDINRIINLLGFAELKFNQDIISLKCSILMGTTSFFLIWILWFGISRYLKRNYNSQSTASKT